jgi:hypothetical protein
MKLLKLCSSSAAAVLTCGLHGRSDFTVGAVEAWLTVAAVSTIPLAAHASIEARSVSTEVHNRAIAANPASSAGAYSSVGC